MMSLFIIVIEAHDTREFKIGAAYWNEHAAELEVERMNRANSYTHAYYVHRWVPYPVTPELFEDD